MNSELDQQWMRRALELAQKSVGVASPNPAVGCVIVRDGRVVGEGLHSYDARDHAEIVALRAAGIEAEGATAYVTLEPCSHTGRTGPCCEALIAAGVARVVAATGDPNPAVHGRGFARMREAGIVVEEGVLCDEARALNDGFARFIQTRLPFVTLKAGISLDGRIAPAASTRSERAAVMLTGAESQAEVQRMRHAADAVVTGIGTVLADDPLLTDRSGLPRRRRLLRVVLDSHLRLPLDSRLVQTAEDDLLVFCAEADAVRRGALEARGVRVECLPGERVSLDAVLKRLGEMEVLSVLLEGGAELNAAALRGFVDKLVLFYAPVVLGSEGVPLVAGVERLDVRPVRSLVTTFGSDVRVEMWLRDAWSDVAH